MHICHIKCAHRSGSSDGVEQTVRPVNDIPEGVARAKQAAISAQQQQVPAARIQNSLQVRIFY